MKLVKGDSGNSDFGLIGRGIEVSGNIRFTDRLNIDGKVTGKLSSDDGLLILGESGFVQAQVQVGVCVVYGTLYGDLRAKSRVEIRKTGRVHGDVMTPILLVEEGALFNGAVKMGQEAESQVFEDEISGDLDHEGNLTMKGA